MRIQISVSGRSDVESVAETIKDALALVGFSALKEHKGKIGDHVESVIIDLEKKDSA
jgi:hypothetical protein